jgi:hypothetical protein
MYRDTKKALIFLKHARRMKRTISGAGDKNMLVSPNLPNIQIHTLLKVHCSYLSSVRLRIFQKQFLDRNVNFLCYER